MARKGIRVRHVLEEKELPPALYDLDAHATSYRQSPSTGTKDINRQHDSQPPELSQLDTLEIELWNRRTKYEQDRSAGNGARTHKHGLEQAPFQAATRRTGRPYLWRRRQDWYRDCRAIAR